MPRASQLHKLNTRGETSDFQYRGFVKSLTQHGTEAIPAVIEVRGTFNQGDNVTATTVVSGGTNVNSTHVVVGTTESAATVADGLASQINGQTNHTASANASGHNIEVTRTTAGTVTVVSLAIT